MFTISPKIIIQKLLAVATLENRMDIVMFPRSNLQPMKITLNEAVFLRPANSWVVFGLFQMLPGPYQAASAYRSADPRIPVSSKSRRYQCLVCGHAFVRPSELERHHRSHTGEKPYRCETCGLSFAHSWVRKKHQIIHERQRQNASLYRDQTSLQTRSQGVVTTIIIHENPVKEPL